jgi:transposase
MFKPNDPITDGITNGIEVRKQRGLEIAALFRIAKQPSGAWAVPSQSGGGKYFVNLGEQPKCTCADHETRGCKCKHIYAVEYAVRREENADGTTTVTESITVKAEKRTTYPQDWPAYNEAQTNEKRLFQSLLFDLCRDLPTPEQGKGRPRIPLSDAVFSVTFKIYSTFSGRRFISDLCEAQGKGYIAKVPHYNSIFNYLEDDTLSAVLTGLIERAALPMRSIESDFAVDSTGFMSSRFVRWYDKKYNSIRQKHDWVKAHLVCGVKTNIVTAVEIHGRDAHDGPIMPSLVETTGRQFHLREVSADKGYSSVANLNAILQQGAQPFIIFKSNANGRKGGVWEKMFHYFSLNREEFLDHYHKRSNIESTVSMIKAKFRDHVRSKTDVAMKNEVLGKILCHNICCLISAMYELGITPKF